MYPPGQSLHERLLDELLTEMARYLSTKSACQYALASRTLVGTAQSALYERVDLKDHEYYGPCEPYTRPRTNPVFLNTLGLHPDLGRLVLHLDVTLWWADVLYNDPPALSLEQSHSTPRSVEQTFWQPCLTSSRWTPMQVSFFAMREDQLRMIWTSCSRITTLWFRSFETLLLWSGQAMNCPRV